MANGTRNNRENVEKMAADSMIIDAILAYCEPWLLPMTATMLRLNTNKRMTIAMVRMILRDRDRAKNGMVQLMEASVLPGLHGEDAETSRRKRRPVTSKRNQTVFSRGFYKYEMWPLPKEPKKSKDGNIMTAHVGTFHEQ